eukprot:TRINITY_DN23738_c0_g1_i1.p1 TRINITY_DN23738_c0_g1~~TRINITY_DN23738_c0_g1_i1.p1  ORF type:complete len:334 (+),score=58.62 TRINITY_DN23738_c0_g1_i1:154-1155(+)
MNLRSYIPEAWRSLLLGSSVFAFGSAIVAFLFVAKRGSRQLRDQLFKDGESVKLDVNDDDAEHESGTGLATSEIKSDTTQTHHVDEDRNTPFQTSSRSWTTEVPVGSDGTAVSTMTITVNRTIICGDALRWLDLQSDLPGSVVTSLPDITELSYLSMDVDGYSTWFKETARKILKLASMEAVVIFYQTDFRKDGGWIDKSLLCSLAAVEEGAALLFHKIVCTAPPDSFEKDRPRPRYSHLLAYSRGLRDSMRDSTADVLADRGYMPWNRAMGTRACELACDYINKNVPSPHKMIVDPFCGHGTVLAIANKLGMDSLGVEKNKSRCKAARNLTF